MLFIRQLASLSVATFAQTTPAILKPSFRNDMESWSQSSSTLIYWRKICRYPNLLGRLTSKERLTSEKSLTLKQSTKIMKSCSIITLWAITHRFSTLQYFRFLFSKSKHTFVYIFLCDYQCDSLDSTIKLTEVVNSTWRPT